jgi:hypothetical protein
VQLDVVAVAPREKRLLIGEAKWGRDALSCRLLTDLIQRSQRILQVAEGWSTQYILFARGGFTGALQEAAKTSGVILVSLNQFEATLKCN